MTPNARHNIVVSLSLPPPFFSASYLMVNTHYEEYAKRSPIY
ncbi:MAG: hypothetical protein R2867_39465 [Caldilineaceae bacterium]